MKITIENTTKIIEFNGLPARIWEGYTESGIKVHAYITRVAIDEDEPRSEEFKKELLEQKAPSPEIQAIPLRMTL
jgi:hypothetical protein